MEIISFEGVQARGADLDFQELASAVVKVSSSRSSCTVTLYFNKEHMITLKKSLQDRSLHTICHIGECRKFEIDLRDRDSITITVPEEEFWLEGDGLMKQFSQFIDDILARL